MSKLQLFFANLINWTELLCAVVGLIKLKSLGATYWKWFVYFIVFIFLAEATSRWILVYWPDDRKFYYDFFVIPIEFIFFYWLYALKSLYRKKLFWGSISIYTLSFLPHLFYPENTRIINSLSYTTGVLLLMIMAFLEFNKQVKSDSILQFKEYKMFYVNAGVVLFYVGTLPFFSFDKYLFENAKSVWSIYLTVFLILVSFMYLLFTASFIWGKPKP